MRMWNVDPRLMCNQHLLGEHKEMHMFVGSMKKIDLVRSKYVTEGLVETHNIKNRHDVLVEEFLRRGWKSGFRHQTYIEFVPVVAGSVNVEEYLRELRRRCSACRERMLKSS